jgi:hypothetical protein
MMIQWKGKLSATARMKCYIINLDICVAVGVLAEVAEVVGGVVAIYVGEGVI